MGLREGYFFKIENTDIWLHVDRDNKVAKERLMTLAREGEVGWTRTQRCHSLIGARFVLW